MNGSGGIEEIDLFLYVMIESKIRRKEEKRRRRKIENCVTICFEKSNLITMIIIIIIEEIRERRDVCYRYSQYNK
jgi:hypothetical protein